MTVGEVKDLLGLALVKKLDSELTRVLSGFEVG